jgi:di/tripeptidase
MDSVIVQTAREAGAAIGLTVELAEGSSDSNIPMSLGVPAITIGGGGIGAQVHALSETFDTTDSWRGTANAVLIAIVLAQ